MEMEGADHRQGTEERKTGQQQHLLQMGKHVSVQLLGCVQLFVTPWTAAHKASLSITNSWSLLKLISIESVMPSNHLILCHPLLLLPSIFPSIRVFSKGSVLCITWLKCWSSSFSISASNEYSEGIPSGFIGLISWQSKRHSRVFSNTAVQSVNSFIDGVVNKAEVDFFSGIFLLFLQSNGC